MERPEEGKVRITGGFWGKQLEKIASVTAKDVLDKFDSDHEEGLISNYEGVIAGKHGSHVGPPWYDGLIGETIRGISDLLVCLPETKGREELLDRIERYAKIMEKAQAVSGNGYINTYTQMMCPRYRFGKNGGNILWQHEIYNLGCLAEAGVHYYRASGRTVLLRCAVRAAECLCGTIGPEPRINVVPAHPLPETAFLELYRLLRDDTGLCVRLEEECGTSIDPGKILELVRFWVDHRGVHDSRASAPKYMGEYAQDHETVDRQDEAVGHAVRAAYFYTGVASLGYETGDEKYLAAAERLYRNITLTKLHISGGIGAHRNEEKFGYQYELPNNAYLETCAGVALAFFAGEMHRAVGRSEYMDLFEWVLYNNVLPCLSADGTHYFYENPLLSDGSIERWVWHDCPCCPPMFLKLMGSLPQYVFGTETGTAVIDLYMDSEADLTVAAEGDRGEQSAAGKAEEGGKAEKGDLRERKIPLHITMSSSLPGKGTASVRLGLAGRTSLTLKFRRPAYAADFAVKYGSNVFSQADAEGYVEVKGNFSDGDRLEITMELPTAKVEAHPYVRADIGRVAITKGPLLYCLEEIDNPAGTDPVLAAHDTIAEMSAADAGLSDPELFGDLKVLRLSEKGSPEQGVAAVPYFLWNNRGRGTMSVWQRQSGKDGLSVEVLRKLPELGENELMAAGPVQDLSGWEEKLYRPYCG